MFKLQFRTDNAAFADHMSFEIAEILREIANRVGPMPPNILAEGDHGIIRDSNGNAIGKWSYTR